jgi:hypothetical protein
MVIRLLRRYVAQVVFTDRERQQGGVAGPSLALRVKLQLVGIGIAGIVSGPIGPAAFAEEGKPPSCWAAWWSRKSMDHSLERAGHPEQSSCLAQPSDTGDYGGYYVGGGCAFGGHYPCADEGTWGWDYAGWLVPRKIFLLWSHGQCYQGGRGAYRTDGPQLPRKE